MCTEPGERPHRSLASRSVGKAFSIAGVRRIQLTGAFAATLSLWCETARRPFDTANVSSSVGVESDESSEKKSARPGPGVVEFLKCCTGDSTDKRCPMFFNQRDPTTAVTPRAAALTRHPVQALKTDRDFRAGFAEQTEPAQTSDTHRRQSVPSATEMQNAARTARGGSRAECESGRRCEFDRVEVCVIRQTLKRAGTAVFGSATRSRQPGP